MGRALAGAGRATADKAVVLLAVEAGYVVGDDGVSVLALPAGPVEGVLLGEVPHVDTDLQEGLTQLSVEPREITQVPKVKVDVGSGLAALLDRKLAAEQRAIRGEAHLRHGPIPCCVHATKAPA